jgi:hypothetical protein
VEQLYFRIKFSGDGPLPAAEFGMLLQSIQEAIDEGVEAGIIAPLLSQTSSADEIPFESRPVVYLDVLEEGSREITMMLAGAALSLPTNALYDVLKESPSVIEYVEKIAKQRAVRCVDLYLPPVRIAREAAINPEHFPSIAWHSFNLYKLPRPPGKGGGDF